MTMAEPAVERRTSEGDAVADEGRLAQFGYKQELKRDWSLSHNFGVSFSIIVSSPSAGTKCLPSRGAGARLQLALTSILCQSVITGITTLFSYGLNTGGPGGMSMSTVELFLLRARRLCCSSHIHQLDRCVLVYHARRHRHGRDCVGNSHQWRTLFLGRHASSSAVVTVCSLAHRMVQSSRPGKSPSYWQSGNQYLTLFSC
jgi:hypothetical protein